MLVKVAGLSGLGLGGRKEDKFACELVKRLGDGLVLRGAELLGRAQLVLSSGALGLQEQLHEVLRPPVAGCPLPVLGPEGRLLLFGWWLLSWFLSFSRLSL